MEEPRRSPEEKERMSAKEMEFIRELRSQCRGNSEVIIVEPARSVFNESVLRNVARICKEEGLPWRSRDCMIIRGEMDVIAVANSVDDANMIVAFCNDLRTLVEDMIEGVVRRNNDEEI